ncbi:MAG: glucose-1-phosphate adenylyltransferase subunit GlgD [Clostridia bacterium]|nr:glucose-1-phosphate adenylyltransferase subunit GlgD [Clostridia bacterium]
MNNVMSVIFASDYESKLNELTVHRTTASLPFCGRYRLIDFALSNLVNAGITQIGIVTRSNYSSLMDHIRMGRDWDLNRKNSGISIFPPFVLNASREMYKGKVEALFSIQGFITHNDEEYVLLTNSNVAMNIDLEKVYDFHIEKGADITILTTHACPTASRRMVVGAGKDGRINDLYITEKPDTNAVDVGVNVYLVKKDLLMQLVEQYYARGYYDWEKDVLTKNVKELKLFQYKVDGYVAIIDDVKSYYAENIALLDSEKRNKLFYGNGVIYTKVKDSVPTVYRENASVKNSLIADGCVIDGTVENSVLFRGVKVAQGAVIRNSIIMENGDIQQNSQVSYAITDKDVTIRDGRTIAGYETYPVVIVKGKTV